MSSKPNSSFAPTPAENSSEAVSATFPDGQAPAADVYSHLLHLMNLIVHSSSAADVIARVTDYLRAHCGCEGMFMEYASDDPPEASVSGLAVLPRRLDASAFLRKMNASPAGSSPDYASLHKITLPLPQTPLPGSITFLFASDAPVLPREMLETLAGCLSMRLADETLRQRADRAEETAARRLREVAAQYDVGQTLAPTPNGQLLQMLVERTALLMEAQACSLLLLDPSDNRLRVAASHGLPPDVRAQTQLLGEGVAGRVALSEQPLVIGKSLPVDPRLRDIALNPALGSAMLAPLKDQENRCLGVLCIRRRPHKPEYTVEDVHLFSVFATHAALALVNARLVEDLDRRASELLKLSTLSRALLSTVDLDTLLRAAVEEVAHVVGCDRVALYLRENNRPHFYPRLLHGYPESLARNPVKIGEGAVGHAARAKAMLTFDAALPVTPEHANTPAYRQMKGFARSLGTSAYVAIPVLTGKQACLGVLVADNKFQRAPLSPDQLHLLQAFVSQAGIAIENALLYEQMHDNLAEQRRLKDYTDNVLQSIEAAILTTDSHSRIVRCNRAAAHILQAPSRDLHDLSLADALARLRLPQEELDPLLARIRHVQDTGEPLHRLKLTLHPHGQPVLTLALLASRLPDHKPARGGAGIERQGVVLIFEDITQEARLEAEVEKMRRLADIGQLAAKMAHEVRNALTPIKGAAQLLRKELQDSQAHTSPQNASFPPTPAQAAFPPPPSLVTEWPDIIIAQVETLSRLTSDMLDFARPQPLATRDCDINAFLHDTLLPLAPFLREADVRLQWQLAADLPPVAADPPRLAQVVRNLVLNAVQSMPAGGLLVIQTEGGTDAPHVALHFRDQGTGIPAADLESIFRPFVTTRPKGTGLGLPVVQKIVAQHGGSIAVQSREQHGTTFTVCLPRASAPSQAALQDTPPALEAPSSPFGSSADFTRIEPPLIYDLAVRAFPDS